MISNRIHFVFKGSLCIGLLSLSLLMGCSFADDESLSSNVSSDNSSSSSSSAQENDLFYFEQDIIYLPLEEDTPVKLNLIKEGKYKDIYYPDLRRNSF